MAIKHSRLNQYIADKQKLLNKTPEDFKKEFLDPVSDSYCLAKWYEATMWLYIGHTASCHHNPTHKIQLDPKAPGSLHNTPEKIHERNKMRKGEKPEGCRYCWNAEDMGVISDRVYKSKGYLDGQLPEDDTNLIATSRKTDHPIPQKLEIAFDRTCNLACSYCEPKFSTTWANDIKKHGSYKLKTNDRFNKDWKEQLYKEEDNPYIQAFFDWWPTLQGHLKVIRFTGGEPLLHIKFWEFMDMIHEQKTYEGSLIVNSNMIHHKGQVERFIESSKFLWEGTGDNYDMEKGLKRLKRGSKYNRIVEIHTSAESNMDQAEFTRDGFVRGIWQDNIRKVLETSEISLTITTAINNMSVWSYIDYLKRINILRKDYGNHRIHINSNRVFHPQFHQVQLIPLHYREELADEIEELLPSLTHLQDTNTKGIIKNHVNFLRQSKWQDMMHQQIDVHKDMIKFLDQYLIRRNKQVLYEKLDPRYRHWINSVRKDCEKA